MIYISTCFGGKSTKHYAEMTWYLCQSILEFNNKKDFKLFIGATDGAGIEYAKKIAKEYTGVTVLLEERKDLFSLKIDTLLGMYDLIKKKATDKDIICAIDCDVIATGDICTQINKAFAGVGTDLLMTETRLHRQHIGQKFKSWIVFLRATEFAADFIQDWKIFTASAGYKFTDQVGLYRAWDKHKTGLKVIPFEKLSVPLIHFGSCKIGSERENNPVVLRKCRGKKRPFNFLKDVNFPRGWADVRAKFPNPPSF